MRKIARLVYDVSRDIGSEDIDTAFKRYHPYVKKLHEGGWGVVFCCTHETWGEGKNEFWDMGAGRWIGRDNAKWGAFADRFALFMGEIAKQWQATGIPIVWQCWNEQDAKQNATRSIALSPMNYGLMLQRFTQEIRRHLPAARVITGGHNSGAEAGSRYAMATLKGLPVRDYPDGIAVHPYGRDVVTGAPFGIWGRMGESIEKYYAVLNKPIWITEWGVLDQQHRAASEVAGYIQRNVEQVRRDYPGKVAAMIWFDYPGGDNGYGVVDGAGQVRRELAEALMLRKKSMHYTSPISPTSSKIITAGWKISSYHLHSYPGIPFHIGVDLNYGLKPDDDYGLPVYAIADGEVVFASADAGGTWGGLVVIDHKNGYISRYGHLSAIDVVVKRGAFISQGTKVGAIGDADGQFAAHLHFDVGRTAFLSQNWRWYRFDRIVVEREFVDPIGLYV